MPAFSTDEMGVSGDESTTERAAAWVAAEESLKSLKREDRDSPRELNDQMEKLLEKAQCFTGR